MAKPREELVAVPVEPHQQSPGNPVAEFGGVWVFGIEMVAVIDHRVVGLVTDPIGQCTDLVVGWVDADGADLTLRADGGSVGLWDEVEHRDGPLREG